MYARMFRRMSSLLPAVASSLVMGRYSLSKALFAANPATDEELKQRMLEERIETDQKIGSIEEVQLKEASFYKENQIYQHEILIKERKIRVLIIKHQDQFYCLSAIDTYDGKTNLGEGVVFGDKLMSPRNGCAYSIVDGLSEHGPALDNLPIFQAKVINDKVTVYIPEQPPKKIRPILIGRDFNDLRRVVLVGSDPAVLSCAETLRNFEYSGDLIVVSDTHDLPIDKTLLSKSVKYFDNDKLELRDSRYLMDFEVNYIFDNPVTNINREKGQNFVELADGTAIDFDGVMVGTGARRLPRIIPGDSKRTNITNLENRYDHLKLRSALKSIKKLTVVGLNMESLQFMTTIRREYPKIHITCVDDNRENILIEKYGKEVSNSLINMQKNRGIDFILGRKLIRYEGEGRKVDTVIIKGKELETDQIVYFPNNFEGKNEILDESEFSQDVIFDGRKRLCVDVDMNANHNKIFAAGEGAGIHMFRNTERLKENSHADQISQGQTAAMNILGLNIPYSVIPYRDYDFYGNIFREAGAMNYHEDKVIEGNLDDFNYTCYYIKRKMGILKAVGFQKQANAMSIIREAIRCNLPVEPNPEEPAAFTKLNIKEVEKRIREFNKSGVYKKHIWDLRHNPQIEYILWEDDKLRMGDGYYNYWKHGQLTPGESMRQQEEEFQKKMALGPNPSPNMAV